MDKRKKPCGTPSIATFFAKRSRYGKSFSLVQMQILVLIFIDGSTSQSTIDPDVQGKISMQSYRCNSLI